MSDFILIMVGVVSSFSSGASLFMAFRHHDHHESVFQGEVGGQRTRRMVKSATDAGPRNKT